MNNNWWILIPISVLMLCCKNTQVNRQPNGLTILDSLYLKPVENNPRTSEGDFIILKNKDILTVYTKFLEEVSDHGKASLMGRISKDNGSTWGEEITIVENEGIQNVMSVSLLRMQNGKIALFYLIKNGINDCYPVMRISDDEGKTWSETKACIPPGSGYFVLNNSRVIQLSSGRILVPVAHHANHGGKFEQNAEIRCLYSDDNGDSWHKSDKAEGPIDVVKQEPGLVELKDGRILMYIRTNTGFQYFSYSSDKGQTWSEAKQGNLVSALSPALIVRDPYTKALVATWNNDPKERAPLSIAVSYDEGDTWQQSKTFQNDPSLWYCYPALETIAPNKYLISFCFGDKKVWGLEGMMIYKFEYNYSK